MRLLLYPVCWVIIIAVSIPIAIIYFFLESIEEVAQKTMEKR